MKLYAPNELAPVVEYGLNTFNDAEGESSHNACKGFNSGGWMPDKAGAICKSLEIVYGHDILNWLHVKPITNSASSADKNVKYSNSWSRYVELACEMEKALTPNAYNES